MNDKVFKVSSEFYYKIIDAAEDGNFDGLDALLKEGADINVRSLSNGKTALMKVCTCIKNTNYANQAINYLVKNGANICLHDDRGETALMIYLSSNKPEYTDISSVRLLANERIVNDANDFGSTPLFAALNHAIPPKYEILEFLLQIGANPRIRNKNFSCALSILENPSYDGYILSNIKVNNKKVKQEFSGLISKYVEKK